MKALKVAVIALSLVLAGCSNSKVLHVVTTPGYEATFYDKSCSVKVVKDMAELMGAQKAQIKALKEGLVTFRGKQPDRKFCFLLEQDGQSAFVIDEKGDIGYVELKK